MDIKKLLVQVINTYVENGGIMHTDTKDFFDEKENISYYFGSWAQPISGHLEAGSEYFYTYDDEFMFMDADMVLNDGDGKHIYLFLIGKNN